MPARHAATSTASPPRPRVELFTDGACSGNPGPGGWAYLLRHADSGKEREGSGGEARTTNNRMELTAAIEGLNALTRPSDVHLVSDSQYLIKGLAEWMDGWKAKGWKRGRQEVVNLDLWLALDDLRRRHTIRPMWIRGHNSHPENERCDRLAVAEIDRLRAG
jgi:ribonuclease HI